MEYEMPPDKGGPRGVFHKTMILLDCRGVAQATQGPFLAMTMQCNKMRRYAPHFVAYHFYYLFTLNYYLSTYG